jgi:hypothetical protein
VEHPELRLENCFGLGVALPMDQTAHLQGKASAMNCVHPSGMNNSNHSFQGEMLGGIAPAMDLMND